MISATYHYDPDGLPTDAAAFEACVARFARSRGFDLMLSAKPSAHHVDFDRYQDGATDSTHDELCNLVEEAYDHYYRTIG